MRRFFTVLTVITFCTVWPISVIFLALQFTFLKENFYFNAFNSTRTYERVVEIAFKNQDTNTFTNAFPSDSTTAAIIQTALMQSITPAWLQSQTEVIVVSILELLNKPGANIGQLTNTISLAEPKQALLPILESVNSQMPDASAPDWLQLFNDQVPDEIAIKYILAAAVNKESLFVDSTTMRLPGDEFFETQNVKILDRQFATIQNALGFLRMLTYGSVLLLIACLTLLVILPKTLASKLRTTGVTLWIASLGTLVTAAIMYIGQTYVVQGLMSQLPTTPQWQMLTQDILSELLRQYSLCILWPSVVGLLFGIGLHILSKFTHTTR